ncbi:MAG: hypothetical protein ACHQNA_03720 [Acidimicrobiales bacterium]
MGGCLVGLPAITVLGAVDDHDAPIVVYVETLPRGRRVCVARVPS